MQIARNSLRTLTHSNVEKGDKKRGGYKVESGERVADKKMEQWDI